MCSGRTQDLEEEQPSVEQELRRLMEKPGDGLEENTLNMSQNRKTDQTSETEDVFVFEQNI